MMVCTDSSLSKGKKPTLIVRPSGSFGVGDSAKFEKCVKEVALHAFACSKCPVILHLKMNLDASGMMEAAAILEKGLKGLLVRPSGRPTRFLSPASLREHVLIWADPMYDSKESFSNPAMPEQLRRMINIESISEKFAPGAKDVVSFAGGYVAKDLEALTAKARPRPLLDYATNTLVCLESSGNLFASMYTGAQLCAVQATDTDLGTWVHRSKFAANGGCGYILKPGWMLDSQATLPRDLTSKKKHHLRISVSKLSASRKGDWQVRANVVGNRSTSQFETGTFTAVKEVEIPKSRQESWMVTVESKHLCAIIFELRTDFGQLEGRFGLQVEDIGDTGGALIVPLMKEDGKKSKSAIHALLKWT